MYVPQIWMGSEDSYSSYLRQLTAYLDNPSLFQGRYEQALRELRSEWDDEEEEPTQSLAELVAKSVITKVDNVGILSIEGPLSRETGFMQLVFGGMGYDSIMSGISMLLKDEEVEKILTTFATPGGDAAGIHEAGSFIKRASGIKPIQGFTSDSALSAGYWLMSSTQKISMGEMAEVGSIGAISSFTSVARALKESGIDVHVQRSGADKAPLHPAEPLSEKGRAMLEEKTSHLHQVFIENVMRQRPQLAQTPLSRWAEGGTYFYQDALARGLADRAPVDLNTLLSEMTADYRSNTDSFATSGERDMTKKIVLTDSAKAALASGAALADVQPAADAAPAVSDATDKAAEAPAALNGTDVQASTDDVLKDAPAAPAEALAVPAATDNALAAYLQATVDKQGTRIESLLTELNSTKAELTTLKGTEAALRPVAVEAIQKLQVAIGQKPSKHDGVSATALAEMYAGLREELNAQYPTGRTSSADAADSTQKPRDLREARLMMVDGGKA